MTKFAVAILLALTMPASAQDLGSANHYLPGCKAFLGRENTPTALRQGLCAGFLDGLAFGAGERDFCPPKGVTRSQVVGRRRQVHRGKAGEDARTFWFARRRGAGSGMALQALTADHKVKA
jgi:hypothetical protein